MWSRDPEPDADEGLPPLGELLAGFSALDPLEGEDPAEMISMSIELPVEVSVEGQGEDVRVRCSPPTQYTETSVLPVFHRLRIGLVRDDAD